MRIGCFALIEPFTPIARQFELIREMGIEYADITDNHNGGMLGVEYGFAASISLEAHPARIREMADRAGLTLTCFCAHANLLDPASPDVYGTNEIIKAIRLARDLGIQHVITSEGDPKTEFGHRLTHAERIFTIVEKLHTPVQWAAELGIELLLEPHGVVTGSPVSMAELLERIGHQDHVGVCLDTGNSWLAGVDPIDYITRFGSRIKHVHWKDLGSEWVPKRGKIYGCGMGDVPLGDGVIGIPAIVRALASAGFAGATTLEVAGANNIATSAQRLRAWTDSQVMELAAVSDGSGHLPHTLGRER
jgi:inosose dehydratase